VSRSDTQPVGLGLSRRVLLSLLCLLLTATGLALGWSSLEPSFAGAAEAARESNPALLFLAGLLFAAVPASCGLLWREAIIGAGGGLSRWDACARYGVGSLVNTFAPAHVGDVVRAALLLRALPCGEPRRMVRCFGLVQGVRIAALAALLLASTLPVELALLPLFFGCSCNLRPARPRGADRARAHGPCGESGRRRRGSDRARRAGASVRCACDRSCPRTGRVAATHPGEPRCGERRHLGRPPRARDAAGRCRPGEHRSPWRRDRGRDLLWLGGGCGPPFLPEEPGGAPGRSPPVPRPAVAECPAGIVCSPDVVRAMAGLDLATIGSLGN
jgi:hypothetical protein